MKLGRGAVMYEGKRWNNWENIIFLTHAADPAKLLARRESPILSFLASLLLTQKSLPRCCSCHHTSNAATLSPSLSTWAFANNTKAKRDRNSEPKGNKERCLLRWLRGVSTAHRGKQDQCHCWDFLICSRCCWGTTGVTHSNSNYCHSFRGIVHV